MSDFWLVEMRHGYGPHAVVAVKSDGVVGLIGGPFAWQEGVKFYDQDSADAFVRVCSRMYPDREFFSAQHRMGPPLSESAPVKPRKPLPVISGVASISEPHQVA